MITPELKSYVEGELAKGVAKETIREILLKNGWAAEDAEQVFAATAVSFVPPAPTPAPGLMIHPAVAKPADIKPRSTHKKTIAVIAFLALFIIGGAGAYAYYSGFFLSLPRLASQAFDSARAASSFKSDITITLDFSEDASATEGLELFVGSTDSSTLKLTLQSAQDFSDTENVKGATSITLTLGSLLAQGEFRMLDNTLYAAITKAPALGGMVPVLSSIENEWISFPLNSEDSKTLGDMFMIKFPSSLSFYDKLTTEQQAYVSTLFREARLVKALRKLPPEKINDKLSYHFVFDLDREGINLYLDALKQYVREIGKNDSELSIFNTDKIKEELGKIQNFKGELWIGQKDKLPYKVMFDFDLYGLAEKSSEKVKVTVASIFDGWNESVSVEAPAESIPFELFLSGALSGALTPVEDNPANLPAKKNTSN